jgi:hypothetical protein
MAIKLVHALYGEPATRSARPASSPPGSRPAPPSGPYVGRNRCVAENDTCNGHKAKRTDYCIGHLNAVKAGKVVD